MKLELVITATVNQTDSHHVVRVAGLDKKGRGYADVRHILPAYHPEVMGGLVEEAVYAMSCGIVQAAIQEAKED